MKITETHITGNRGIIDNRLFYRPDLSVRYNEIRALEPLISADMRSLAHELGTDFDGTEYSVKTAGSVEDKLQRAEAANPTEFDAFAMLSSFKDLIRYTEMCEHDKIFDVARDTIDELKSKGYELSGIKNYYATPSPGTGYQGLHLNFITPYGQEIELQVHSEESFRVKQDAHGMYEKIRAVSTPVDEKERLSAEMRAVTSSLEKPHGFESLQTWSMEPTEKDRIINERMDHTYVEVTQSGDGSPSALAYSVFFDGEKQLFGFEHTYSDGSCRAYQNNIRDGSAVCATLDSQAVEITSFAAVAMEPTFEQIMNSAIAIEEKHSDWMTHEFGGTEREDLENSLDISEQFGLEQTDLDIEAIEIGE